MSAAGTIDLPHSLSPIPQRRISAKVRDAIRLMVEQGQKRADAARNAGITDDGLYKALQRPDVCAYRSRLMEVVRTSAASRTIARAEQLADDAESEHVRLQANTWLAGIDGISPVVKTENTNTNRHLVAGLTIVLANPQPHDVAARVIDGQAREVQETRQINRIGQSVPHPSMRNALQIEAKSPGKSGSAGEAGGGQKCANGD